MVRSDNYRRPNHMKLLGNHSIPYKISLSINWDLTSCVELAMSLNCDIDHCTRLVMPFNSEDLSMTIGYDLAFSLYNRVHINECWSNHPSSSLREHHLKDFVYFDQA